LATSKNIYAVKFRKKSFLVYPVVLTGVFAMAIVLRLFFFGVYIILLGSMERTIVPGDVVWVNKLLYGSQAPSTPYEIPWINVLFWLAEGKDADINKERWKYRRLSGYTRPKHGDVTVFNHPYIKEVYIKRCMALPGDTIQIENGIVYVNHEIAEAPTDLFRSRVSIIDMDLLSTDDYIYALYGGFSVSGYFKEGETLLS
jgi:signal peptidase I